MSIENASPEIVAAFRELPVTIVDGWSTMGQVGGLCDITFHTQVFLPNDQHVKAVPVARLRFNQAVARLLRDALDAYLNPAVAISKAEVN